MTRFEEMPPADYFKALWYVTLISCSWCKLEAVPRMGQGTFGNAMCDRCYKFLIKYGVWSHTGVS